MSNESVAAELRKLLMKNNQLEQLLLANWVAGDNPGAIVNIPGLAGGIAELLGEAAHTGSLEPLIAQLEAPDLQEDVETILVQMETFASESVGTRACRDNVGEFARRLRAALAEQPAEGRTET